MTFIHMDYEYAVLDSAVFLFGFIIPVLTFFAYIEYTYINILNTLFNIVLNIQVVMNDSRQLAYLIYSVYSFICVIIAFINVHRFYKEQSEGVESE